MDFIALSCNISYCLSDYASIFYLNIVIKNNFFFQFESEGQGGMILIWD